MSERLSVLVLTEDTGDDAHDTISAVAKKLLLLLEPGLEEHHPRYASAVPQFEAWSRSPAALDEQERPKRAVGFHDRYNLDLAEGLPAGRLQRLGLSFAETLTRADRPGLREVLTAISRDARRT